MGRQHHIPTAEGWLYLAVVLDLFNREIVGWSIKPPMTADIVVDALTMAWFRRNPESDVIFHSDRGSLSPGAVLSEVCIATEKRPVRTAVLDGAARQSKVMH